MKYRKQRIAWSVVCGVLCLLMLAWWVRSWWWQDHCGYAFADYKRLGCISVNGLFRVDWGEDPFADFGEAGWFVDSHEIRDWYSDDEVPTPHVRLYADWDYLIVEVPHWVVIVLLAVTGTLPWWRCSRQFSLRTLLIAATVVAVILGLVVTMLRGS
jgi:hypothetical protein